MLFTANPDVENLVRDAVFDKIKAKTREIIWYQLMFVKFPDDSLYAREICRLEADRQKLYFAVLGKGYAPWVWRGSGYFLCK